MKKNTEIVRCYFNAIAGGDFASLDRLLHDEVIWHQPGKGKLSKTYRNKREIFKLFEQFMAISQGSFKIDEVKSIMENGDLVTATLRFSAHKSDDRIAMDGVDVMKIEDGKIKEVYLFSSDIDAEDRFWSGK